MARSSAAQRRDATGCPAIAGAGVEPADRLPASCHGVTAKLDPSCLQTTIGRPVAGAHRAFDRGRQAGFGPIAGQRKIAPSGAARPGAGHSAPAWPRMWRAARARSARAAAPPQRRRRARTSRQIIRGNLLARMPQQPVGAADRDADAVVEGENPFGDAVDDAGHRRQARRAAACGNAH